MSCRAIWLTLMVIMALIGGAGAYLISGKIWIAVIFGLFMGAETWLFGGLCIAAGRLKDD